MSTSYEDGGRTRQKLRTRTALVDAARALLAEGLTPTVEAAAERASISRTTAYRYFPSQRALLVAAHPEVEWRSLLPDDATEDAAARLDTVVAAFLRLIVDTEPQQRTMLRLSLEEGAHGDLPLRKGRAIAWIGEALSPLRGQLPEDAWQRLVLAIRSTAGIEALVWLVDVAGLSRDEAVAVMRWSADALLRAAIADTAST
jgi:AcrR family transcriptional regulator